MADGHGHQCEHGSDREGADYGRLHMCASSAFAGPRFGSDLADAGGRRHFHLNHFVFLDLRFVLLPGAYLAEAGIRVPLL